MAEARCQGVAVAGSVLHLDQNKKDPTGSCLFCMGQILYCDSKNTCAKAAGCGTMGVKLDDKGAASMIEKASCNDKLEVGYGRVDITPDYPVGMAGSASSRLSEGAMDPLYVTFIAIRQGENTFLVATMDLVGTYEEYAVSIRSHISRVTGVPEEHVILNSTHTHSSVSCRNAKAVNALQYRADLRDCCAEGATAALEDLSPAEVWYGSIRTQGMIWVRHYKMADGTFAGANYGSFKSGIVGHASQADPEMQVIRFARDAEDKKDIVLMNFPAHATINQKSLLLSADFPGPAREYVAEKTGALVAYFIAGGGDQVPVSRVPEENFSTDYKVYGREVGRFAVECMKDLTKVENAELGFAKRTFMGKSNKTDLDRADEALAVKAIWDQVGGRGTKEGRAAAKEHGFWSVYEVTAILNRMHFPENRSMELKSLAIGDVSLIFAPYEMFGSNAMQIKEGSPYPMTFIVSCSQNHDGYLPSRLGCQIGCYEAQITKFQPGTAEKLVEEYIDILKDMKKINR